MATDGYGQGPTENFWMNLVIAMNEHAEFLRSRHRCVLDEAFATAFTDAILDKPTAAADEDAA
jgi:hypothetical protein